MSETNPAPLTKQEIALLTTPIPCPEDASWIVKLVWFNTESDRRKAVKIWKARSEAAHNPQERKETEPMPDLTAKPEKDPRPLSKIVDEILAPYQTNDSKNDRYFVLEGSGLVREVKGEEDLPSNALPRISSRFENGALVLSIPGDMDPVEATRLLGREAFYNLQFYVTDEYPGVEIAHNAWERLIKHLAATKDTTPRELYRDQGPQPKKGRRNQRHPE